MGKSPEKKFDFDSPFEIAQGIFWVGFFDRLAGLHCNPYLIVEDGEAVLIDAGGRPEFPQVIMKVLQTGISPAEINALIYHHYDPDLCGSIPNLEDLIDRPDLPVISEKTNHMFLRHFGLRSPMKSLEDQNYKYVFSSGRELRFINTPYAHSQGSFVTFDTKTGTLFSSDLFGSYSVDWTLILPVSSECESCPGDLPCPNNRKKCFFPEIRAFHRALMPSTSILQYAMEMIRDVPMENIAPQHGSVILGEKNCQIAIRHLKSLTDIGIDGLLNRKGPTGAGGRKP